VAEPEAMKIKEEKEEIEEELMTIKEIHHKNRRVSYDSRENGKRN
jgi:hypothetical protein